MTLAEQLAEFAAALRYDELPHEVKDSAKARVLDTVGVALAARTVDASVVAAEVARRWGGPDEASALGGRWRGPAAHVALVNGTLAHALDFDDTHLPSVVHPSATLVPTAFAQAEAAAADGRDFLTALVAGYEVSVRLSMAQFDAELGNSVFFERGLHATASIGALASAVVAAKLRGLDESGILHALGIACSMAAGLAEANRTGGTVKRIHCGWAAHCAVTAAMLAESGLTGPPTCLEGRFGFFQAFCDERWHPTEVTDRLGDRWDTPSIAFKPYPCNHFTHAIADAALALRARGLIASEVRDVKIGTAQASWRTIGDPIEQKRKPQTPYHAKFSGPFVFAAALVGESELGLSHDDFTDETLTDRLRAELASRCSVVVDEECTAVFPYHFPAVVEVRTTSGHQLVERVMTNLGTTERPLTPTQFMAKLRSNAGDAADLLQKAVDDIDSAPSVEAIIQAAAC